MIAPATQPRGANDRLTMAWSPHPPELEVVIPVYNEEAALSRSMTRLHRYLGEHIGVSFIVTIADNASTDRTPEIAQTLARELDHVRYLRLAQKGRGRALRTAWSTSHADVVEYMDVDLSTDLIHLSALLDPLSRLELTSWSARVLLPAPSSAADSSASSFLEATTYCLPEFSGLAFRMRNAASRRYGAKPSMHCSP